MKPITFENLRRFVGGGRKKKDKESSFKRSDSFKRISIRKSYLDRGKKKHLQKLEVATQTVPEELQQLEFLDSTSLADTIDRKQNIVVDTRVVKRYKEKEQRQTIFKDSKSNGGPGQSVIAYGQWLKGICKDDSPTTGIKGSERTVIYVPASDEQPIIRQLTSSPTYHSKRLSSDAIKNPTTPLLTRKESNDSAVEMFPWGDSVDIIKKSPLIRRKQRPEDNRDTAGLLPENQNSEELCSLSISLGRIWMDAPKVMSPRSLELPQRANSGVVTAHNSLDSALKDLRDDGLVLNRLQKRPGQNVVGRTLSSTSNATTTSTGLFSSKDSGFSFSISIPKLEVEDQQQPAAVDAPKGFFRKKKQKPKLSVSRDGYFKRTSGALLNESTTNSRRSSFKKSSLRKRNFKNSNNDLMYQVVVNRPPRCLKSLKLDPMIFVPPEKRQTNNKSLHKKPSFKLSLKEIRNCNPNENEIYLGNKRDLDDSDEGLYESLPDADLADDCLNCSYDMVLLSGRVSRLSIREDDGFPSVDAAFSSEDEADVEIDAGHSNASSALISPIVSDVEEEETVQVDEEQESVNERTEFVKDDCDYNSSSDSVHGTRYLVQGVSPVPRRKPVRRRKSGVLLNNRITYVARPVFRAPSTLKRTTKKYGDITQKGYEKKRTRLLSPYVPKQQHTITDPSASSSSSTCNAATGAGGNNCTSGVHSSGTSSGGGNREGISSSGGGGGQRSSGGVGVDGSRDNKHRERDKEREREQQSRRRTQRRVTHNEKRYHSAASCAATQPQRQQLLQQQQQQQCVSASAGLANSSPSNRAVRRGNRRLTRNESRYHSEVRQEAVQQALAQAMQSRHKPSLPMPSKRTSVMARSPDKFGRDSAESTTEEDDDLHQLNNSDSDSLNHPNTNTSTPERDAHNHPHYHYPLSTHIQQSHRQIIGTPPPLQSQPLPPPPAMSDSTNSSTQGSPPPPHHRPRLPPPPQSSQQQWKSTDITNDMHNFRPYASQQQQHPLPPDVTHVSSQQQQQAGHHVGPVLNQSRRTISQTPADRVTRGYTSSAVSNVSSAATVVDHTSATAVDNISMGTASSTGTGRWKVSAKIQQLLNTLKRPKRRPLPEFYEDDDIELELAANVRDPNAPKPEGSSMTPVVGEQLVVPSGLPRNIESAITRYGSASFKASVATVLDPNGKLTTSLTYGKLLSRSYKIAYALLTKSFGRTGDTSLKSGDRIALVYPNSDPVSFLCAFYGCLHAGVVPVPIEVPITRRDAGSLQIGFLLGSCGVQVALTSEACLKGLPKTTAGEVAQFKGWPRLHWFVTEHLARTPKDWVPAPRLTDDTPAYIEYSTDRDGSVMGVTVTRAAMLSHCRTVTMACGYTEGENMVCVLDFKREVGLWHSVLASVLNGMHVIYIPYALMKVNPASWMQMITKYRASVAVCKSRDLHWGLLATKDHRDISLASLRMLLVADGANPWSLSSCDQFLSVFQPKGLKPDAICPSASSSEVLTVSVRRPGRAGVNSTGRGVLSMQGLSYGVVRVDQENSLTSLTLQDCGQVMPGCVIVVVKMDGPAYLCKTDEVGEICINSGCTGTQYWGLTGLSTATFRVSPINPSDGHPISDTAEYTRSGLLGFLGPGGLVFICGSRDGLMTVTGRKHNADDIIATVLAVEPMKFIYRGRIAVFSHRVLRDERVCVIAEQRPDCSEEESFQWMSRVLQAVDSIHQVGLYCLALVPPNYLPKTPLGGIHLSETKRRFLEGTLHPANVLLCPHTCVTNLPKPREIHSAASASSDVCCVSDVGPASVIVGNLVQGNRLASAQGRDMGDTAVEDGHGFMETAKKQQFISEILRWRAQSTADHVLFTLLNSKGTVARTLSCAELHKKAERVAQLLTDRGRISAGAHVALIFPPGLDLVCAFYGCLYAGAVPVTIRPPHPQNLHTTLPTVRMIVDVSKAQLVLSIQPVIKLLKSKEASNVVDIKSWPSILDTEDSARSRKSGQALYRPPTSELLAYLDFSVSTTGMLAGIKMSHAAVTNLCRSMKLACELYPSRHIALCLDPYCGLGFALWCLSSIYSGHHSILIPPSEVEVNPGLWLGAVSQYKVRDTFCSYGVMELCTKGLGSSVAQLKSRSINLSCVRTCVVVAEERPRIHLTASFSKLFSALGLSPRAVSTSFGCRVNVAICLQGASSPEPSSVYVDLRALRNDRVSLVERGSPHSLCLMESGKLLPGVKVIIANPETRGQCGDSHLGEIWVQAGHVASGYFTIYGDDGDCSDHFNTRLVVGQGNTSAEVYARTGYLGFLRRTEGNTQTTNETTDGDQQQQLSGVGVASADQISQRSTIISCDNSAELGGGDVADLHDAVFVVGALDETILLRGMRYHPIDIESSVLRCHKKIAECAVFTWTNLLVVVAELDGNESEALDLVPLITNAVLEEQQLVVGVVVVVDPGVVPINSRGEKQRMHLRDGFLADQLDPIYVAYNM